MKKFVFLATLLFLSSTIASAEFTPTSTCPCNDISSQIQTDKKVENQTKQEMIKMDEDAQNLEKQAKNDTKASKHKKSFWRIGKK